MCFEAPPTPSVTLFRLIRSKKPSASATGEGSFAKPAWSFQSPSLLRLRKPPNATLTIDRDAKEMRGKGVEFCRAGVRTPALVIRTTDLVLEKPSYTEWP